jgi:hypothetical protein
MSSPEANSDRIRQKRSAILAEMSSLVNVTSSLNQVLEDIKQQLEICTLAASSNSEHNKRTSSLLIEKQDKLMVELSQWSDIAG